jgi:hypothetical protein
MTIENVTDKELKMQAEIIRLMRIEKAARDMLYAMQQAGDFAVWDARMTALEESLSEK